MLRVLSGIFLAVLMQRHCTSGQEVMCPILIDPVNGQVNSSSTTVGSEARYECFLGFELNATEQRICQENGTWSGVEPSCITVDCGTPSLLNSGEVGHGGTTVNSIAFYTCDEGHELNPSNETSRRRVCQADGNWFGPDPTCEIVDCGPPSNITPGNVSFIETVFNSTATYVCDEGYVIIPFDDTSRMRVCQDDGNWFGPDPTCERQCAVQLVFDVNSDCNQWILLDTREKIAAIDSFVQSAIAGVCGCNFTVGNDVGDSFSCPDELPSTAVLYRADLRGVQGVSCNELTNALGRAIESNPDLSVLGNQLDLITTCDVNVTSVDSDFSCDESGGISTYMSNTVWYYFLFPLFAHL